MKRHTELTVFLMTAAGLFFLAADFPAAFHPQPILNRIRIGIAARDHAYVRGEHIYYTKKTLPRMETVPGGVYRRLFRIPVNGTQPVRIADLGNVRVNPVFVPELGKIFYTRRITDSNKNGRLDFEDNRIVCILDFDGSNFRKLTDTSRDMVHLAYNPVKKQLLIREGNTLLSIQADNPGVPQKILEIDPGFQSLFFDYSGELFIHHKDGYLLHVKDGIPAPAQILPCVAKRGDIGIFKDYSTTPPQFIRMHKGERIGAFSADNVEVLFPLDKQRDMLLGTEPGAFTLFIGNAAAGTHQKLFAFPEHTTRVSFSHDFKQAVFLGTFDTDNDGRLRLDSMDKSALYHLQIGE